MGGIIGGIGNYLGAKESAQGAKESAAIQAAAMDRAGERALTGYNYLTSGAGAQPMNNYIQSGQAALRNQGTTQNLMMDLLGITNYANQKAAQNPAAPAPVDNGGGGGGAPTNGLTGYMGLGGPNSGQGPTGGAFWTGAHDAASGKPIYSPWAQGGQTINITPPQMPVEGQPYAGPYPGVPMAPPPNNALVLWGNA